MSTVKAVWSLSLDCECPKCEKYFDILDEDDFWGRGIAVAEHDTKRSKGIEVQCEHCEHEFTVDLVY